jgi:hypothetical protein
VCTITVHQSAADPDAGGEILQKTGKLNLVRVVSDPHIRMTPSPS